MEFSNRLADGTYLTVSVGAHAKGCRDNVRAVLTGAEDKPCANQEVVMEGTAAIEEAIAILQRMLKTPLRQI